MLVQPTDLTAVSVRESLEQGWHLRVASIDYLALGAGSYHWRMVDDDGRTHFVTVDDLDGKDWLGDTRVAVFAGLGRAFATAESLRTDAGLDFVVAPVPTRDGFTVRRLDDRYSIALFPYVAGRSWPFGPYADVGLRQRVMDLMAEMHRARLADGAHPPRHTPLPGGLGDLVEFVGDPERKWEGGPFAAPAHRLFRSHSSQIAQLVAAFVGFVEAHLGVAVVVTHGEPHPANLVAADGRLFLVDWDTVALAPPERDLSLVADVGGEVAGRYAATTGYHPDPALLLLYRARWFVDELGRSARLLGRRHGDTADVRRTWDELTQAVAGIDGWLAQLDGA